MNKKFFENMKLFANVVAWAGGICVVIMLITCVWVDVPAYSAYSSLSTRSAFSWTGLVSTLGVAVATFAGYYIVKGIALLGIKAYSEEEPQSGNSQISQHSDPGDKKSSKHVLSDISVAKAQKQKPNMYYVIIGVLVLAALAIGLSLFFS